VSTTSGRRQGVAAAAEPESGPQNTKAEFRRAVAPAAAYIALQPSPYLMRAAARRIAAAVIATGDELAQGGPNRWEDE
jgi:hypothetical protein